MGVDEQLVRHLLRSTRFSIATATMGARGWARLAPALKKALNGGAGGRIIIGLDLLTTDYESLKALRALANQSLSQLEVKVFYLRKAVFHPKLAICRVGKAGSVIVGSSNLSGKAFAANVEYDVVINAPSEISRAETSFNAWWNDKCCYWLNNRTLELARRLQLDGKKVCSAMKKAHLNHSNAKTAVRPPERIKGYTFAFTGGLLSDTRGNDWPRKRLLYPLLTKLGGYYVETPSKVQKADCIVDCTSYNGSVRADTLKRKAAADLKKLVISPRAFWKIVEGEYKQRGQTLKQ